VPYQTVNPYSGKVLRTFKELTAKQLEKAPATAATCYEAWRHTSFIARAALAKGATIGMGGKRIDRFGAFMQPTILTKK